MKHSAISKNIVVLLTIVGVLLAAIALTCWLVLPWNQEQLPTSSPESTEMPTTTIPTTMMPTTTMPEKSNPETSVPESTASNTTLPETTVLETCAPNVTVPEETTAPKTTETTTVPVEPMPVDTMPAETAPPDTIPQDSNDIVPTEKPVTDPQETVPPETYGEPIYIDNGDGTITIDLSKTEDRFFMGGSITVSKYCEHCGREREVCHRWLAGSGDHTCPDCGETVPSGTCHFCDKE